MVWPALFLLLAHMDSSKLVAWQGDAPPAEQRWEALTDRVMGGVSNAQVRPLPALKGGVRFTGDVSLANNGGFASSWLTLPEAQRAWGVYARLRPDGNTYEVRARAETGWRGVSYRAGVGGPAGEWSSHYVPLTAMRASWRGRPVPEAPDLRTLAVARLGVHIADKQEGDFAVDVAELHLYTGWPEDDTPQRFDLGTLQWQARPLLVFAEGVDDAALHRQHAHVLNRLAAFRERDMTLTLLAGKDGRHEGEAIDRASVGVLREQFGVTSGFAVVLVGKDGGEKWRATAPSDLDEVFALVDTMPMRQREMRAQQ